MPDSFVTSNLNAAVLERLHPAVTTWNRLEGRPRADKFDRALKAEVRDALWMLSRQWQMGEFKGDDAGSPIIATLQMAQTRIRTFRADAYDAEPFDDTIPLETCVEARPLSFRIGARDFSLDLRLLMGRQWLKMLRSIGNFDDGVIARFPIHDPDPDDPGDSVYCAHPRAWSTFDAVSGRRMDGAKLYLHLKDGNHAWDGIAALDPHHPAVDALAARFVAWFERLVYRPPESDAWLPDRLEYQFACAAPERDGLKALGAEEYYQGHLDWYSVDVVENATVGDPGAWPAQPKPQDLIPTPISFDGMPNTRWWTFEDGRTNFGDIKPDTTDLGKLLLMEFGLIYANDWFLIPYTLPAGSIARVRGMSVTNVFGERTWVEAAGSGEDDDWQRWAMFLNSVRGNAHRAADLSLTLLPTAMHVQEGHPLEDVMLIRDEMANMVWGVERVIPLPTGEGARGIESARERRAWFERDLERRLGAPPQPPAAAEGAAIRFELMTGVPENWIPFVPVHVDGDNREIQLQRAAIPRVLVGDPEPPAKVRPRTSLLRHGLEDGHAYFVHEEEVPRAGVRVTQQFQRTRWRDGRVWVWFGVRKQTGRGEGSSRLAYDRILEVKS